MKPAALPFGAIPTHAAGSLATPAAPGQRSKAGIPPPPSHGKRSVSKASNHRWETCCSLVVSYIVGSIVVAHICCFKCRQRYAKPVSFRYRWFVLLYKQNSLLGSHVGMFEFYCWCFVINLQNPDNSLILILIFPSIKSAYFHQSHVLTFCFWCFNQMWSLCYSVMIHKFNMIFCFILYVAIMSKALNKVLATFNLLKCI